MPRLRALIGLALIVLLAGCVLEGTPFGAALLRALDRVGVGLRADTELMFRATCGFFFVAIWAIGGILLTPN